MKVSDGLESERFTFENVLYQRLCRDMQWYAVYDGQIIDRDQYRHDLIARITKMRESTNEKT